MIKKVEHIGIAVKNIDDFMNNFVNILNMEVFNEGVNDERGIRFAFLKAGDAEIELVQPVRSDAKIAQFIDKNGEGLHHIAFQVQNINQCIEELNNKGVKMVEKEPVVGASGELMSFVDSNYTSGVIIQLVEDSNQND